MEIILSNFSDNNGIKLEINHRKNNDKKVTTQRLNNMILKKQWFNEEIKREIKVFIQTNDNGNTNIKN